MIDDGIEFTITNLRYHGRWEGLLGRDKLDDYPKPRNARKRRQQLASGRWQRRIMPMVKQARLRNAILRGLARHYDGDDDEIVRRYFELMNEGVT